jgi:chemotaxis protein CheZ
MSADLAPSEVGTTPPEIHHKIGVLTRQLHDSLSGLGLTEKLQGTASELPDAKSRLTYIARLTGEAAEKVLNRVDQAKAQHDHIAAETRRLAALIVKDPVAAVVNLAATIEEQLVQLLIETAPPSAAKTAAAAAAAAPEYKPALAGPVVNPEGNTDVVTDQSQVDDLLASLGF